MNFVLVQQFKLFNKLLSSGKLEEAEVKLKDISSSLSVVYFNPLDKRNYKKDALPLLLVTCLPLTFHENIKLRLQAQSTLNHWSALVSAFSPHVLLECFQNFDVTTLKPEAHAAIFSFWTNALRCVSPNLRSTYMGFLHPLLVSSKPDLLTNVTMEVWKLIRETLEVSNIHSVLPMLVNSPLDKQVAFLCEKSPNPLFNYVLKEAELQFIKKTLPYWPDNLPFDMNIISKRLLDAINGENSSEISTSIEIVSILVQRKGEITHEQHKEIWTKIYDSCINLWNTKATIAQKAAIIDLLSKTPFVSIDHLEKLIIFDDSVPSPIKISIVKLCSSFVAHGKIPKNLFEFLENELSERDPLMYIAILEFLARSINDLYKLCPQHTFKLLERSLTPLPKYFVEQVNVIKIFKNIDYSLVKEISSDMVQSVMLQFLKDPHPSVIQEMKLFFEKKKKFITLPISKLDWVECSPQLIELVRECDPFFISELIDGGYIPPASYPYAIRTIIENIDPNDKGRNALLIKRALYVVTKATSALGFDHSMRALSTKEWTVVTENFEEMVNVINDNLQDTSFGMILASSLDLLNATIPSVDLHFAEIETLYTIAIELSPAYCEQCCDLVSRLHDKFSETHHVGNSKKERRIDELKFTYFRQSFPFASSVSVSRAAIKTLPDEQIFNLVPQYIEEACFHSPEILNFSLEKCMIRKLNVKVPLSPIFLLVNSPDYIKQSYPQFPYHQWKLEEDQVEKYAELLEKYNLVDIKVTNYDDLDGSHKELIARCPNRFVIQETDKEKAAKNQRTFELPIDIAMNIPNQQATFLGFDDIKETVQEEPVFSCSFKPYPHQDKSLSSLIQFLWISNRRISDDKFKDVEQSILPFASTNPKAVISFLGYAARHGFKINAEKWAESIKIKVYEPRDLIAFGLLTYLSAYSRKSEENEGETSEEVPLSQAEERLRANVSLLLGINYKDSFAFVSKVANTYGAKRFALESIMYAEKERFEKDTGLPLFKYIFHTNKVSIRNNIDEILDIVKPEPIPEEEGAMVPVQVSFHIFTSYVLSFISRGVFPNTISTPYNNYIIPPNVQVCDWIEKPRVGLSHIQQDFFSDEITDKLLKCLVDNPSHFVWLAPIISEMRLKEDKFAIFLKYIQDMQSKGLLGLSPYVAVLATQKMDSDIASDLAQDFENLPPSYTRMAIKCILNKTAPKQDKKLVEKLFKKAPTIMIEVSHSGSSRIRKDIVNTAFGTFEEAGPFSEPLNKKNFEVGTRAIKNSESYAMLAIRHLVTIPEHSYVRVFPDVENNRFEALAKLVLSIVREDWHYAHTAIKALKMLEFVVKPKHIIQMISTESFMSGSDPIVLYAIAREVVKDCYENDFFYCEEEEEVIEIEVEDPPEEEEEKPENDTNQTEASGETPQNEVQVEEKTEEAQPEQVEPTTVEGKEEQENPQLQENEEVQNSTENDTENQEEANNNEETQAETQVKQPRTHKEKKIIKRQKTHEEIVAEKAQMKKDAVVKIKEIGNLSNIPVLKEALLCDDKLKGLLMILKHNYIE